MSVTTPAIVALWILKTLVVPESPNMTLFDSDSAGVAIIGDKGPATAELIEGKPEQTTKANELNTNKSGANTPFFDSILLHQPKQL